MLDHQFVTPALDRSVSLRRQITTQAMQIFAGWGYREIQIPLLEHFDSLKSGLDEDQIARSFRFVDRAGNLMVLRPDVTPAVAKTYAYQLRSAPLPLRVSYSNKVVRIERAFVGAQLESYQVGLELIGAEGLVADVEVLLIVLELLERLGLKRFQINLADHKAASLLLSATGAPSRFRDDVEDAILARDPDEVRSILNGLGTRTPIVEAIAVMASLEGGLQKIDLIERLLPNEVALKKRLDYLRKLEQAMADLGYGEQVRVDLGEIDGPGYYTGIGFSVVAEGAGRRLARGGRYDELIGLFGQSTAAVGFSFSLEAVVELLHPQAGSSASRRQPGDAVSIDPKDPVAGLRIALERRRQNLPTRVVVQSGDKRDKP
ncbi:MAG: ATP phosphoribosyltransferase regulatory subunit [Bradymonadaceae bacterium]|nr:ATP phosphoribosyltransferase regulatory subunit [Lujinxingiaceae bacterium]